MATPGSCNVLREAADGELVVAADFSATGRTTATFRDLVQRLEAPHGIWEIAPVPYGQERGMTGRDQVERWVADVSDSGLTVRAVLGFCGGSAYAAAIAEAVAEWQGPPALVVIDPGPAEPHMLGEHVEGWLRRLASTFEPEDLAAARRRVREAAASSDDPLELAAALSETYREIVAPALVRAGQSAQAGRDLTDLVTGYLHWFGGAMQLDPRPAWAWATALYSRAPDARPVACAISFDVSHADMLRTGEVARAVDDLLTKGPQMNAADAIRTILAEEIFVEVPPDQMTEYDSLRDVFGLDSVGFVELRVQLQERFGVTIPDDDFTPDSFDTIRDLVALLDRLRPGHAAAAPG